MGVVEEHIHAFVVYSLIKSLDFFAVIRYNVYRISNYVYFIIGLSPSGKAQDFDSCITLVRIQLAQLEIWEELVESMIL